MRKTLRKAFDCMANNYRSLDRGLLYGAFILILYGVFLIFAAGPGVSERTNRDTFYFINRQLVFLVPTVCVMMFTAFLDSRLIRRISGIVLLMALMCMVYVVLFGSVIQGSKRWMYFMGIGLQPSEFVKPSFAVVCAWFLASGRLIRKFHGYIAAILLFAVVAGLLVAQPDIGMAITITIIFSVELFLSGIPFWVVGALGALFVGGLASAYLLFGHVRDRVNGFLDPEEKGYQVRKSLETLQNAGWFGKGPGEGVVKYELPDAHTDFIMAVSAEEFGFILTFFLIGVFLFVILRGFYLLRRENTYFFQIAVGGLLTQIAFQAIVNMGSTLSILPTKGMTLPFISYGGSSLVSVGFAFGVILGLTKRHTFSRELE